MAITVELFDEQSNIFIYHFVGNWNWDELHQAFSKQKQMLKGTVARCDNIIDLIAINCFIF